MPDDKASLLKKKFDQQLYGLSADLPRIIEVKLTDLRPNPHQPRKTFDKKSLKELANSIELHGLLSPITVMNNPEGEGYIIAAGERRYRAHGLLGRETIWAIRTDGDATEIAIIENLQREDLNPIEEAEALALLKDQRGYTHADLAKVVGKARNTVTEILRVNTLPEAIKEECRTSDIASKSVLIELARVKGVPRQLSLWEQFKQSKPTVRSARAEKGVSQGKDEATPAQKMLATGRSFVRRLEALSPEIEADSDTHAQLLELKKQISRLIR